MPDPIEILVPLLNPNEPEVQVARVHVVEGQKIQEGDPLCTLESTKSVMEVIAVRDGFIIGLECAESDLLRAGDRLCWLADDSGWTPPEKETSPVDADEGTIPEGIRITKPGLRLVRDHGLDPTCLPRETLITESVVRRILALEGGGEMKLQEADFDAGAIVVYGGGGHGKSVIDLVRALGKYQVVGVIDDGLKQGVEIMGVPVMGGGDQLSRLAKDGVRLAVNAVGGIGDITSRIQVFIRLVEAGFGFPTIIHPTAFVEPTARLSQGVQVFPHAYIGSDADVGFGTIINTAAVVSHDCRLGAYVNVAPGALLAGAVTLDEGVLIGMGATLNLNVTIGSKARIGNSAVVKEDIPSGKMVRAGEIWPKSAEES
jgi:sugar O-acyltransferase (sialic acid O-acetyltransferase NeuD family)